MILGIIVFLSLFISFIYVLYDRHFIFESIIISLGISFLIFSIVKYISYFIYYGKLGYYLKLIFTL